MKRTTIRLDGDLLAEAKQRAARSGLTLTAVIEQALRESFSRRPEKAERRPVSLTTWGEGWLRPGVDLDDSAALLELMEREDAPS
ncbi:MAG: ribbon-helix-helix domain-containing protein [Acidobacteriota bacterium]|nr:ribbon-helix-helix domain-containing protein [Acidobacteriota bacterium]